MEHSHSFWKRFQQIRLLGRGGFGEVLEVVSRKFGRCAAKIIRLPVQLGEQPQKISQEVSKLIDGEKNLCDLRHENIVKFVQFEQLGASVFVIVMELLVGRGLETLINKRPLEDARIRCFAEQICGALLYMHNLETPVIHRDLNCSNIIVLEDGSTIKLIDFGLSLRLQNVTHCTGSTHEPKGTTCFMAPELFESDDEGKIIYSKQSDIWAFGCAVYQMAAGLRPHHGSSAIWKIALIVQSQGAPALPDGCCELLKVFYRGCTAFKRNERLSAAQLLRQEFLRTDSDTRESPNGQESSLEDDAMKSPIGQAVSREDDAMKSSERQADLFEDDALVSSIGQVASLMDAVQRVQLRGWHRRRNFDFTARNAILLDDEIQDVTSISSPAGAVDF